MADETQREFADEYVLVGDHAEILSSGRGLAVGEHVAGADLADEDGWLVDDERLVDVTSFEGEKPRRSRARTESESEGGSAAGGEQ